MWLFWYLRESSITYQSPINSQSQLSTNSHYHAGLDSSVRSVGTVPYFKARNCCSCLTRRLWDTQNFGRKVISIIKLWEESHVFYKTSTGNSCLLQNFSRKVISVTKLLQESHACHAFYKTWQESHACYKLSAWIGLNCSGICRYACKLLLHVLEAKLGWVHCNIMKFYISFKIMLSILSLSVSIFSFLWHTFNQY